MVAEDVDVLTDEISSLSVTDPVAHSLTRDTAWTDKITHAFFSTKGYFERLVGVCSLKFVLFLSVTQFLVNGLLMGVIGGSYLPIFKELGVDAATQQLYMLVCMSPWTAKPFIGILSDVFLIGGYNKKYWIFHSVVVGMIASAFLTFSDPRNAEWLVACFVAINYEMSVTNLLSQGKYSGIMREHPEIGTDIVTFDNGSRVLGGLIAACFVGPMSDDKQFKGLFCIALVLCITPFFPTCLGWLPEAKRSREEEGMRGGYCCLFDHGRFVEQRRVLLVATLVGLGGPIMVTVTTFANRLVGIIVSFSMLVLLLSLAYKTLPRIMANVLSYAIAVGLAQPGIGSALDYFYTADDKCLPDGPNFDYSFYITCNGVVRAVFSFTAVLFYQSSMSTWRYRPVLISTLVISCLASVVDLVIVMRWNATIGIPDKPLYIVGSSIVGNVASMLYYLPFSAILSKVCPRGVEAATFAFLSGVIDFVEMLSTLLGALIIDWAGLKTVTPDCDFSSLWILILTCNIVAPLLIGVPATWLIPNVLQTEKLIDWGVMETDYPDAEESNANGKRTAGTQACGATILNATGMEIDTSPLLQRCKVQPQNTDVGRTQKTPLVHTACEASDIVEHGLLSFTVGQNSATTMTTRFQRKPIADKNQASQRIPACTLVAAVMSK